jgi:sigma-54 dependent transcriptional regulator, acetoin dehydrogenase operon transcriptional activator AcoR
MWWRRSQAAVEVRDELRRQLGGRDRELMARLLSTSAGCRHLVLTIDARGEIVLGNELELQRIDPADLVRLRSLARGELADGIDRRELLELAQGSALVQVDPVQCGGDPIDALLTARLERARPRPREVPDPLGLTGASAALLDARRRALRIWEAADRPLLVTGEAGTGKTLLAHGLLATLPGSTAASDVDAFDPDWSVRLEHAFDESEAVLLEHIDELSPAEQRRLSARLDAAPGRLILTSTCRRDELERALANRLAAGTATLPPLRERDGDLPLLIDAWCAREERRLPPRVTVTAAARERIARHAWPGHVGELFGVLDAARLVRRGAALDAVDLELPENEPGPAGGTFDELQLQALRRTLRRTGGNVSAAARVLGVSRSTLHRRLNSYRLRGISDI